MRIDSYPRMAFDRADYLHPDGYKTTLKQNERRLEIVHCLEYESSLPAMWLRDGSADLCCEVRIPQMLSSCRYDCKHSDLRIAKKGSLELSQVIDVPDASDKRMYFLPAVVLSEARCQELSTAKHGVSALWDKQYVRFPKGAILAGGTVHRDPSTTVYPLDFVRDDTLQAGTISASPRQQDEYWKYVVRVPNDLLMALRDSRNYIWLQSVYVGALAQMLVAIQKDFGDPDVPRPPTVEELGKMIRDQTQKLPPWETEENEWDDTLQLATILMKDYGGLLAPPPGEDVD